jgi:hypothetical protein
MASSAVPGARQAGRRRPPLARVHETERKAPTPATCTAADEWGGGPAIRMMVLPALLTKQGDLLPDSGRDPVLVSGGEEVKQSAPEHCKRQGAAGGSFLDVALGLGLARGQDS